MPFIQENHRFQHSQSSFSSSEGNTCNSYNTLLAVEPPADMEYSLNDIMNHPEDQSLPLSGLDDDADSAAGGSAVCAGRPTPHRRGRLHRRRSSSSGLSFEKHDSLIFEELSHLISGDEEGDGDNDNAMATARRQNNEADVLDREVIASTSSFHDSVGALSLGGASAGGRREQFSHMRRGSSRSAGSMGNRSLTSVLEDIDIEDDDEAGEDEASNNNNNNNNNVPSIIVQIEQDIINREVRYRNPLVRTRSEAALGLNGGSRGGMDRFPRSGSSNILGRTRGTSQSHRHLGRPTTCPLETGMQMDTHMRGEGGISHPLEQMRSDSSRNQATETTSSTNAGTIGMSRSNNANAENTGTNKSATSFGRSFLDSLNRRDRR